MERSVQFLFLQIITKSISKVYKICDEIKHIIETINKKGGYEKDFMIIKCNSHDNLSLNKILKLHKLTVIVRSVFEEDGKYYSQVCLDEYLYKL